MAAKKDSGQRALLIGGGVVVGLYIVMKYLPKSVQAAGSGSSGSAGGGAYYPYPGQANSANQSNSLLAQILRALQGQKSGSSGSGSNPAGSNSASRGNAAAAVAAGDISVAQALAGGYYTGSDQNTLAGIFNMQNGAGDFAGDSSYSVGQSWLDSGMGLGDLLSSQDSQLGYQDSSQLLDMSAIASPVYNDGSQYAEPIYSNYDSSPSIDFNAPDMSNIDLSGGGGGGGGYDSGGGDSGGVDTFGGQDEL